MDIQPSHALSLIAPPRNNCNYMHECRNCCNHVNEEVRYIVHRGALLVHGNRSDVGIDITTLVSYVVPL